MGIEEFSQFEACLSWEFLNVCSHEEGNRTRLVVVGRGWELFRLALALEKGISKLKETCSCSHEEGSYYCYKHSVWFCFLNNWLKILSLEMKRFPFSSVKAKHSFICSVS